MILHVLHTHTHCFVVLSLRFVFSQHEILYTRKAGEEITAQMYNFVDKVHACLLRLHFDNFSFFKMQSNISAKEFSVSAKQPLQKKSCMYRQKSFLLVIPRTGACAEI